MGSFGFWDPPEVPLNPIYLSSAHASENDDPLYHQPVKPGDDLYTDDDCHEWFEEELTDEQHDAKLALFLEWATENGLGNNYGLVIEDTPIGRGLVTHTDIPESSGEDCVIKVPQSILISNRTTNIGPEGFHKEVTKHANDNFEVLALLLMYEKFVQGADSRWARYLDMLPRRLNHTVFYSADELAELKGCDVLRRARWINHDVTKSFEKYHAHFVPRWFPPEAFTKQRYKWAVCLAWGRSFLSTCSEGDATLFLPFADMANFMPHHGLTLEWREGEKAYALTTSYDIQAGTQIYAEYGDKDNEDLMLYYGFALLNNPFNAVKLEAPLPRTDPLILLKHDLLHRMKVSTVVTVGQIVCNSILVTADCTLYSGEAHTQLLPVLRILAASTELELQHAKLTSALTPLSHNCEVAAFQLLIRMIENRLKEYPHSFAKDKELLKSSNISEHHRNAVIVRHEEKRILLFCRRLARACVAALNSRKCSCKELCDCVFTTVNETVAKEVSRGADISENGNGATDIWQQD